MGAGLGGEFPYPPPAVLQNLLASSRVANCDHSGWSTRRESHNLLNLLRSWRFGAPQHVWRNL